MSSDRDRRIQRLRPYAEKARRMRGWTFEYPVVRLDPGPPWDYPGRARELLAAARSVLDIGTGGGERFAEICNGFSGLTVAIEGWSGNIHVAAERLSPLGVAVVRAGSIDLPFLGGSFDLVLDRHEGFSPDDVCRILEPGGHVLTQQVHHTNWHEFRDFFPGRQPDWGPTFQPYQDAFTSRGLIVTSAMRHETLVAFRSLGEVVYYLTAIPWTVLDFDLEGDLDALIEMEQRLMREEGIVLTESRYMIEAHKPAA